ncbi:MAG: hypothetical protein U9N72_04280 [Bacteroidota bacterium]|nr:hypothetical protein [Bacteroidota bacterium]
MDESIQKFIPFLVIQVTIYNHPKIWIRISDKYLSQYAEDLLKEVKNSFPYKELSEYIVTDLDTNRENNLYAINYYRDDDISVEYLFESDPNIHYFTIESTQLNR